MADFIDEVKEDLKRERMEATLRKYGQYGIGLIVAVVVVTASISWYSTDLAERQEASGDAYIEAVEMSDIAPAAGNANPKAQALLDEVIQEGTEGYQELAVIRKAGMVAKEGNIDEAIALYDQVVADASATRSVRELAGLHAVHLMIEHGDHNDPALQQEITNRLEQLISEDSGFYYSAKELQAFYLLDNGKEEEARAIFESLDKDAETPNSMRGRAEKVLAILNDGSGLSDIMPAAGSNPKQAKTPSSK